MLAARVGEGPTHCRPLVAQAADAVAQGGGESDRALRLRRRLPVGADRAHDLRRRARQGRLHGNDAHARMNHLAFMCAC